MSSKLRIRSALFTPGTEVERMRKAAQTEADACIFDLEDSVPMDQLEGARRNVGRVLSELGGSRMVWVRVHPAGSPEMKDDLEALRGCPLNAVVLPKVDSGSDIDGACSALQLAAMADLPLVPIVETPGGALNCADIASARGVVIVCLGRFDLSAALGIDPDGQSPALSSARAAVVLSSAAAALPPPLDSPWVRIDDLEGLGRFAVKSREDGFGGMLLIHPKHVAIVNQAYRPTSAEREWAAGVVGAAARAASTGKGAFRRQGEMVDEAMLRRARLILESEQQDSRSGQPKEGRVDG
jgi:citrate lyase beta subunit